MKIYFYTKIYYNNEYRDKFYKKLKLPEEIREIMKVFKKIKKQMLKDASITGVGK